MVASTRVVQVWCDGSGKVGSGYRVDEKRLLTARHVVDDADECAVRFTGETEYRRTKVVWRGGEALDVAVLEFVDDAPSIGERDPKWATSRGVDGACRAAGYPAFLSFDDGAEREEFVGELRPLAGAERGVIHAAGRWAGEREGKQWGGMSGAGLFSGAYLIGVVTEAMADRLIACPVSKLFDDASFREAFPDFRVDDIVLWPEADRPAIRLLRPRAPRSTALDRPPSELLLAHNQVVPFDDEWRGAELALLEKFSVDRGAGLLVFTGPGGAGKTRLMIEWCARMRARGWVAGFVERGHADVARATEGQLPRVLVVDYPEGHVDEAVRLCRTAQAADASVRVVMLARSKGPWFDELRREVEGDLVARATWHELGKLDEAQRLRTYERAHASFSFSVGGLVELVTEDLGRDELPLFAHMRALLRAYGEGQSEETPEKVLALVLEHERKHWRAHLERLHQRANPVTIWRLERVLTAVVLFGGVDAPLGELLQWLLPELPRDERDVLGTYIVEAYGRDGRVGSLQPDLLGEQLVYEVLARAFGLGGASRVEEWLGLSVDERAPQGSVGQTLRVLTRLVDRGVEEARGWLRSFVEPRCGGWVQACVEQRHRADPRGHEFAEAVRSLDEADLAGRLEKSLPESTVELMHLGVEVLDVLLRHTAEDELHERARLSNSLGKMLSSLGRREEALAATQEALVGYRELARRLPNDFQPDLAMAINNLGTMLSSLGRREEALVAAQEAVEIYRELTKARSDGFQPDLAMALNNLGPMLSLLGRREEALAAVQEAVEIYRQQTIVRPDAFQPDLARAFNNLGVMLSSLGRREEAIIAAQAALDVYREQARARPDAFLPDLARALNNLGGRMSELGKREEALTATREAVDVYQELARERPDAFLPDLARALNNLGTNLSELGKREEALEAALEAVEIRREQARERPGTFLPDLAMALNNLGKMLSELGKREEALEATREAVEVYREQVRERPDTFLPNLAMVLNNLGAMLSKLGKREEALAATQEAMALYRELARERPDTFLPNLAMALNNLGVMLSELEKREDALAATQESMELYRDLARKRPDTFLPYLATILGSIGSIRRSRGEYSAAVASFADGVRVMLPFAKALPIAHSSLLSALARSLYQTCMSSGEPIPTDLAELFLGR